MGYDIFQFILFLAVLLALAIPLSKYAARVLSGEYTFMDKVMLPVEKAFYRAAGIKPDQGMNWAQYAISLLIFNLFGMAFIFLLQLLQGSLPLNPQHLSGVKWDLAINTAVSFITNTNWQAYSGESTMSYLTQMLGMTVQNFVSAATGIAVAVALIRGFARNNTSDIGNFWVDLTRSTLWILLPLSIVFSLLLVSQGVIQNFGNYLAVKTWEGGKQLLAMGPVASQEAIKILGTNGGGFFNANSAHPFENPTPFSNFMQMISILLIPSALALSFGRMVGDLKQGRAILAAMTVLFVLALGGCYWSEIQGNPQVASLGVSGPFSMEGKEVRFGVADSALFAVSTTAASCGAVNSMHDSLTPLGGMIALLQIMLGEVIFGGVGAGLYGMLVFVLLTVFIVGLMVGRTPEYMGKKVETREMKMVMAAILLPAISILVGAAIAAVIPAGTSSLANAGPHGLSEILYAFASAAGNNGSAFAGLNANTTFYNLILSLAMLIGRFGIIIPVLVIAGGMAEKKTVAQGAGTFQTGSSIFVVLLVGIVLIVGALTFFPALALGPILEQLLMTGGLSF